MKSLVLALVVAVAAPLALAAPEPAPSEMEAAASRTIAPEACRAHVEFLASDLLEGRATPSRGLAIAGEYVAVQWKRFGLEPGGDRGTFFQSFPISLGAKLVKGSLERRGEHAETFSLGKGFVPLPFMGQGTAEGQLVFAGYGITDGGYDDYAGIDARGKVVLVLRHDSHESKGGRLSRHAFFETKIANAVKHGAVGLLLVTDPANHEKTDPENRWPLAAESNAVKIPAFHVSLGTASSLLSGRDLRAIQQEIDGSGKPRSFEVEGVRVALGATVEVERGEARNVIGVLRGGDAALAASAVVIGAHYDHVGVRGENGPAFPGQIGRAVNGDRIYNGADDNASGTSALIEIARAFSEEKERPPRSIVFIAFAGEELGLLGSKFQVEHPLFPLKRTIAMLNLDMVGRNAPGHVYIGGHADRSLGEALAAANRVVGLKMEPITDEEIGGGSDHDSFDEVKVPTIFFFTGEHDDYHRVTDEASKIDAKKVATVARLAFLTAALEARLAGTPQREAPSGAPREPAAF